MLKQRLYLDANASVPLLKAVRERLPVAAWEVGNPSSVHSDGQAARALIERARAAIRRSIGANPDSRVIFTSGATEANHAALHAAVTGPLAIRRIVTSDVEHPSILEAVGYYGAQGIEVVKLSALGSDQEIVERFANLASRQPSLFCLMLANNETGQIYPVANVFKAVRAKGDGALCHSDAVQAFGKMALNIPELMADSVSLSGHKIGALAGVGALVMHGDAPFEPTFRGGAQETRLRAGTENVVGIVSFGIAAELVTQELHHRLSRMNDARNAFWSTLVEQTPVRQINCNCATIPNTLSIMVPGILADDLVVALDLEGVSVSAGAACASGKPEPSHVLRAIGLSDLEARSTVRVSFTPDVTAAESTEAAHRFARCVRRMAAGASKCTTAQEQL